MLFLFALVSLVCTFVCAVQLNETDYEGSLNTLVNGLADETYGDEGIISHTGVYESLYKDDLSQFNYTMDFMSGDNYGKVEALLNLASKANDKGFVGDLIYLAHFASAGGYNGYMQLNDESSFAKDLLGFCENDATIFTKLSQSSSNKKLQDFFESLVSPESDASSNNKLGSVTMVLIPATLNILHQENPALYCTVIYQEVLGLFQEGLVLLATPVAVSLGV
ncbi:uncharacterized protein SOCG_01138 [Schizosaccharomyces octosporus yFS286]|uniref:WD-like domain-containing protein n=1 Tax=Schizosaccharomyces octosporus (strain yFS286) TaxID=483514 RepID=S9RH61_SCHOY|nr:uncharacterized protein SOCG_01138 [Schizosaccharomyces octosporus yFS286]EPX73389.1 hypothetical protein SOCG_01138 [Schizosaccharomyces octosporus yFS286]